MHTVFLKFEPRNGYQAVDLYKVDIDGSIICKSMLECGSAKECSLKVDQFLLDHDGRPRLKKATRKQAKKMLMIAGIRFKKDFFQLRFSEQLLLYNFAKLSNYRQQAHANGSLSRYFFKHLQTKISL